MSKYVIDPNSIPGTSSNHSKVFTKLASQLTTDKLVDLAIIPLIFVVQTLVSFICSFFVSKAFGFSKRPRNFVIAMGVSFPPFPKTLSS